MLKILRRLFVIKTRWEACAVIYALALGACDRGFRYVEQYPGIGGWLLFLGCTGAVFLAGAKLLEVTRKDNGTRRRKTDLSSPERGGMGGSPCPPDMASAHGVS